VEQHSGVIVLRRGGAAARVYVSEGNCVDAESQDFQFGAHELMVDLIQWTDGDFEIQIEPVQREGRLAASTTALLIDIARVLDERSRESFLESP